MENRDYTDEELEAYLNGIELIEPPKAMADEIINCAVKKNRGKRNFMDSQIFQVSLSLAACFVLLFTGTFQSIVNKTIQYNGQISSYIGRQALFEQKTLQEKLDQKMDQYQQKIDKGLERYEKK